MSDDFIKLIEAGFELSEDCDGCLYNPNDTGEDCNGQCLEEYQGIPINEFIMMFAKKGVKQ